MTVVAERSLRDGAIDTTSASGELIFNIFAALAQFERELIRALFALTRKARYAEVDINNMLAPLNASTFQDLSREDASRLISALQTEVAA